MSTILLSEEDTALAIATAVTEYEGKLKLKGRGFLDDSNSGLMSSYVSAVVYGTRVLMLVNGGYMADVEYSGVDAVHRALKLHRRNIKYYVDIVLKGKSNNRHFIAPAVGYCQIRRLLYFRDVIRDVRDVSI